MINIDEMIAGKTKDEILLMGCWKRCRWYKTISQKEKEKAMRIVDVAKRVKIRASWTSERRAEYSKSKIGNIVSEETCVKISISKIGEKNPMYGRTGKNHPNFGKTFICSNKTKTKISESWTPEKKNEMSESMIERWKNLEFRNNLSGENASSWQGGKSFEPYGLEFNNELKEQIRQRDSYTCQKCGITEKDLGQKLDVHHIDYDKTNNKPENLICLCKSDHVKTNFNRADWIEYFRRIMED